NLYCALANHRLAESVAALSLSRELAEAAMDADGVTATILFQMSHAITQGRFAEAEALDKAFQERRQPHMCLYRPGDPNFSRCLSQFYQGKLTKAEWQAGYDLAVKHRNISIQPDFLVLRAEWDLGEDRPDHALEAIDQALQITNKRGIPAPGYHALRA